MKQFLSDVKNARKNRIALEKFQAAVAETSDLVNPQRPSLRVENYRYRNRRDLLHEILGTEFHPFGDFRNSKIGWRKVMEQLAIPNLELPKLYGTYENLDSVNLNDLPDSFVIKPDAGLASLGVIAVRRTRNGEFENLLEGKTQSWTEIVENFEKLRVKNKVRLSSALIAEELLSDPETPGRVPSDWKFFVGAGKVFLSYKVTRIPDNGPKGFKNTFAVWDADLNPHPQLHSNRTSDPKAVLPTNIHDLIAMAETIAGCFAQPVCRIDLYNLPGRIVFGEYTPNPGGNYDVGLEQDERLGRIWLEAEVRYNAMLLKKIQELGHPKYGLGIWKP